MTRTRKQPINLTFAEFPVFFQLHAGTKQEDGTPFYISDDHKNYWSGIFFQGTAKELLDLCNRTIADLYRNHPELLP